MGRRLVVAVVVLAGAAFVGWLVLGGAPLAPGGRTLVYARGAESESLDPHDIDDGESVKVCNQIFETLVTYAPDSAEIVPGLAERWETSPSGLQWTFHLRPGVRFHDGTLLDANAVVFNFERILQENHPDRYGARVPYRTAYEMIRLVVAPNDLTVVFQLKSPSAVFLANLAMFSASIASPVALRLHRDRFRENPSGTGPFRLQSWSRGEQIVLAANEEYWGGKPAFDRVIFTPVRENSVRLERLRRGEFHIMDGLNLSDLPAIEKDPNLRLLRAEGMNFGYLAFNTSRPPFDQPAVRKAIAHAIDKKRILELAYHGYATTGPNPIPPTVWGYHEGIQDDPHDLGEARRLLATVRLPEDFKPSLWVMPNPRPYMPEPSKVAQVIEEDLRQIGLRVRKVTYDWTTYRAKLYQGEHDMCLLGWITDNGDPDNFLYALLASENSRGEAPLNISFYRNPEYDEAVRKAQGETGPEARLELYRKAQEILHDELPLIPLAYVPELAATRREVVGYRIHPIGIVRLKDAYWVH